MKELIMNSAVVLQPGIHYLTVGKYTGNQATYIGFINDAGKLQPKEINGYEVVYFLLICRLIRNSSSASRQSSSIQHNVRYSIRYKPKNNVRYSKICWRLQLKRNIFLFTRCWKNNSIKNRSNRIDNFVFIKGTAYA